MDAKNNPTDHPASDGPSDASGPETEAWVPIRKKLEAARSHLQRFGSIQRKGRIHVLRYREREPGRRMIRRSIALGSDVGIVEQTRNLLADWQSVNDPERAADPVTRQAWHSIRAASRMLNRADRRAFLCHFRAVGLDLKKLWLAAASFTGVEHFQRMRRRPGRPRKGRLAV